MTKDEIITQLKDQLGCAYPRENIDLQLVRDLIALSTQPTAPAVVEGWQLVPKEPTGLMTLTGQQMRYTSANSIGAIYREMLVAAPTPPEGPQP